MKNLTLAWLFPIDAGTIIPKSNLPGLWYMIHYLFSNSSLFVLSSLFLQIKSVVTKAVNQQSKNSLVYVFFDILLRWLIISRELGTSHDRCYFLKIALGTRLVWNGICSFRNKKITCITLGKTRFPFQKILSTEATGGNMIITSFYDHEVLRNL